MGPPVTLIYRPRTPVHYVARLDAGGWCEGWGWTKDDAIADLARVICEVRPTNIPPAVLSRPSELIGWLRSCTPEAALDDNADRQLREYSSADPENADRQLREYSSADPESAADD